MQEDLVNLYPASFETFRLNQSQISGASIKRSFQLQELTIEWYFFNLAKICYT